MVLTATNTYTGTTSVSGGTLQIGGSGLLGNGSYAGAITLSNGANFMYASSATQTYTGTISGVGTTTIAAGSTFLINNTGNNQLDRTAGGNLVVNGVLEVGNGAAESMDGGAITLNGGTLTTVGTGSGAFGSFFINVNRSITANGSGNVISGTNVLGIASGVNLTLNTPLSTDVLTVSGSIINSNGGTTGGLIKAGNGTVTMSGANTYSGATTVNAGTLKLDFSLAGAPATNILLSTGTVTLAGGTLALQGKASTSNTQTLGGLILNAGYSAISAASGASGSLTLALGAITRNAGGFINFTLPAAGSITTTTVNGAGGFIGTWATVNGTDWAASGASGTNPITAYTGYTTVPVLGGTITNNSTSNVQLVDAGSTSGNIVLGSSPTAINTLEQAATANAGTIATAGNTLSLTGILIGSGKQALTVGAVAGDGVLMAASAGGNIDLINNSTNTLTLNAVIANNTSASTLGVSGTGVTILNAVNTYTGVTTIATGATLQIGGAGQLASGTYAGNITDNGSLVYASSANQTFSGALSGAGSLTKSGASVLTLSGINSSYTGSVVINAGTLALSTNTTALGTSNNITLGGNNAAFDFGNSIAAVGQLTVAGGITGATVLTNSHVPSFAGIILNSPLTITPSGSAANRTVGFTAKITGNGGGSGNDSLTWVFSGANSFFWEYDIAVVNDFVGNVHIKSGTLNVQQLGSGNPGGNVLIPDASMLIIDSGSSFRYNNTAGAVVETIDGLSGGGTIDRNTGFVAGLTLTINANNTSNEGNRIFTGNLLDMSAALTLGGIGTQEFRGASPTFNNGVNFNNGTLTLTNTSGWASNITIGASNSPTLLLNTLLATDAWTFSKNITGGSANTAVTKTGSGTVTITGTNTYTGGTTIAAGVLQLGSAGTTGTLPTGSAITDNGVLAFNRTNAVVQGIDFSSLSITGTGGIAQLGSGTLTLNVSNAYSGGTTLTAGVLAIGNNNALGSGTLTITGGSLDASTSGITLANNPQKWSGNFGFVGTNSLNMGTGAVTLTTGVTISTTANTLTEGGAISTAGNALSYTGTGNSALTLAGSVTGNGSLIINSGGTLNLSGTSFAFGGLALGTTSSASTTSVLNITSGTTTFNQRMGLGSANGARGMLNLSGGTLTATGDFIVFAGNGGSNLTASGVINQTGGVLNANTSGGVLLPWAGNAAYGAYMLSAGTLTATSSWNVNNQNFDIGLFSQSGGSATFSNALNINLNSGGAAIVDVSGGTLTHTTAGNFMATAGSTSLGVLTVRGSGVVSEQTGNFFVAAGGLGVVNVLSGGTLVVNRLQQNTGTGTVNFDGGTLRAFSTNAGANFFSGVSNALVYGGGVTVDTNGTSVTIGQALSAPTGFGIGTSGGTITIASGGGAGYIAPPVVTFAAPASGRAATGVALLQGNGRVTGHFITSPGSGYTTGQSVAVTFNAGNNAANEASTAATFSSVNASTLNTVGGLTKIGTGALTLSNANTFTGPVNINTDTLSLNAANALGTSNTITLGASGGASNPTLQLNAFAMTLGALVVPTNVTGATIFMPQNSGTPSHSFNGATLSSPLTFAQSNAVSPNWDQITWNSKITGNGGGSGNDTLIFNNTSSSQEYWTMAAGIVNDFSGNVHIKTGAIFVQSGSPSTSMIPSASMLIVDGQWAWNTANMIETFDGLGGGGTVNANAGSGSFVINANNSANDAIRSFTGTLSALNGMTLGGSGTQALSGANITYTGGTSLNNGTLKLTNTSGWASNVTIGASNSPTLQLNTNLAADSWTFSKTITGGSANATVSKTGPGTVILQSTAGANTYTGLTSVTNGTLAYGTNNDQIGTGDVTVNGSAAVLSLGARTDSVGIVTLDGGGQITGTTGVLTSTGSFEMKNGSASAIFGGSGIALNKTTGGTVTLTGSNTFSGLTTISAGVLSINNINASFSAAQPLGENAALTLGSAGTTGTLLYTGGTTTLNKAITVTNSGGGIIKNSGGGTMNLTGGISKDGSTLTLTGGIFNITTNGITGSSANSDLIVDAATVTLGVADTYNGPTYLRNAGIINANVANALPTANGRSPIIMDDTGSGSSNLVLGASQAIASLTGAATSSVNLNANTLTIGAASGSTTFAGGISGTNGALIKDLASTLTLGGNNTFTGGVTINGGVLQLGNAGALNSTTPNAITFGPSVAAGTKLQLNGNSVTISALNTNATPGSPVIEDANATTATLTLNTSITNTYAGILQDGASGTLAFTKSGAGTLNLMASNTYTGATSISAGKLVLDHSGSNTGALGNTAVSVGGSGSLQVKGNTNIGSGAGGTLNVASSNILSLLDGTTNTLSTGGNLTLNNSIFNLELGSTNGSNDAINVGGAVNLTGTTTINLSLLSTLAGGSTSYTLISAPGGGLTAGGGGFTIGARPTGFNTFSLATSTTTAEILTVTATATPGTAYWTGLISQNGSPTDPNNNWGYGSALGSASNWSTNVAGTTDAGQVPGSTTDVFFTAANASSSAGVLTTQLDTAYTIKSLTFDTSPQVTTPISSVILNTNSNTLTIGTGGLNVASTDNSNTTINGTGSLLISASENWANNNSTKILTINAAIGGTANSGTQALTLNGTGAGGVTLGGVIGDGPNGGKLALLFNQAGITTLSGNNTFTGGVTIHSGTVAAGQCRCLELDHTGRPEF